MKTIHLSLFVICLITLSCNKNNSEIIPELRIDKKEFTLSPGGGSDSVLINSNTKWEISGIPVWININPSSGQGNSKVLITSTANTNTQSRSANLILKANGTDSSIIHVTQPGATPYINLDKLISNIKSTGGTDSIIVSSNVPWKIEMSANATSWLFLNKTSDTAGTSKIRFTVSPSNSTFPRNASLTFSSTGAATPPVSFSISQEQPDVVITSLHNTAAGGENFTIIGRGFSPMISQNTVKINGLTATVSAATTTSLTVTTPMKAGSGELIVTVNTKADTADHEFIYKWKGIVTTIAGGTRGYKDGIGTDAEFESPTGLDVDASGNIIVADYGNYRIRKISPSGVVSTLPGRTPINRYTMTGPLGYGLPNDVTVDASGNIYVVEFEMNAISKITPEGTVTLFAGGNESAYSHADGLGTNAMFYRPVAAQADASGNVIVVEQRNHMVRKITPSGYVTTVAGSTQAYAEGTGWNAKFNLPQGIAIDVSGNYLITDRYNNRIRKVTPSGVVTTFAGDGWHGSKDGTLTTANITRPNVIAADASGNVYFTDENYKLRWITPDGKVRSIDIGSDLTSIHGIAVDKTGNIYVSSFYQYKICKVTIQ